MKNENYKNIKTFSDACIAVGIIEELFNQKHESLSKYLLNTAKLEIINKAINENWSPDWANSNEYKYYPYFNMSDDVSSGFGFSGSRYYSYYSTSNVGSRLCYENKEQAIYAANQFIEIYKAVYKIDDKEQTLKELYSNTGENIILEVKNNEYITKDFDYKTIKTYDDACKKLGISSNEPKLVGILPEFKKATIAQYKLMIVYKAINNGWVPDWSNSNEYKYYPYKSFVSSGFGFSGSGCSFSFSFSIVGSRLCTYSSDIANYIGEQFNDLYVDWFCINNNDSYNITLEDMKTMYSIFCITWKEKIISLTNEYKDKNPFIDKVYLPEKIIDEIIKACTKEQLPIVKGIFDKALK